MQPTHDDVEALLRQEFLAFVEKVFLTLHFGQVLQDNWHIEAICYQLSRIRDGELKRLMINVPPRMLKSLVVSVAWPAFLLGHDPSKQIMVVSHNLALATELAAKFRQVVNSAWYKDAFPTMAGAPAKDNEQNYVTSKGGKRIAISIHGSVTGMGADFIIVDDPLDSADAASEAACAKLNDWLDNSLSTRVNNPKEGVMVLVMQRLSIYDASAHLAKSESWYRLVLPAFATSDLEIQISPTESHLFQQGDLLDPERLSLEFLRSQRIKMGKAAFQAQYQQSPVPEGGGEIDIGLFQRYTALPKAYDCKFLSIDTASGSQAGSYSVIQLFQVTDGKLYMLGSNRGYWTFPTLRKKTIAAQENTKADFIVVEKASSGVALLEELWAHYPIEIRQKLIQKRQPKHSKEVRMAQAMVEVEAGKVLLPTEADWLPDLMAELQSFPAGANDDQVDALSHAVAFYKSFLTHPYNPSFKGWGRVLSTW